MLIGAISARHVPTLITDAHMPIDVVSPFTAGALITLDGTIKSIYIYLFIYIYR
jgi:hypothetical protein